MVPADRQRLETIQAQWPAQGATVLYCSRNIRDCVKLARERRLSHAGTVYAH